MELEKIEEEIRKINDKNGWIFPENAWNKLENFIPTKLMLCVSELSEALEAYRNYDFENFKEEIADTMIRLLDLTTGLNINIGEEIVKKLEINKKRGYKHGNKRV